MAVVVLVLPAGQELCPRQAIPITSVPVNHLIFLVLSRVSSLNLCKPRSHLKEGASQARALALLLFPPVLHLHQPIPPSRCHPHIAFLNAAFLPLLT